SRTTKFPVVGIFKIRKSKDRPFPCFDGHSLVRRLEPFSYDRSKTMADKNQDTITLKASRATRFSCAQNQHGETYLHLDLSFSRTRGDPHIKGLYWVGMASESTFHLTTR
ncbi:putative serine-rich protein C21513-like, partial [Vespula squamosa]